MFMTPELGSAELSVLREIESLRHRLRWQLHEPRRWYGSLRRISMARNIQGSNSIEGYDAPLDDAAAVDLGEEPLDANQETRLALTGYRNAMTYVLQLASEPDFSYSEQLLKSLHFMMVGYNLDRRPGLWRAGPVFVYNDAEERVVHEGAEVEDVPALMTELVGTLHQDSDIPVMIRAGMAHLNLALIHPFRDGNGRMARGLQTLVLAREGILTPIFASIEEYLGRNTQAYYDVLAAVGGGRWAPEHDARGWVRFTLTAHLRQARTMLQRIRDSERLWSELEIITKTHRLPDRAIPAMFDAALRFRIRNATYRAILEDEVTEATASRDLRQMVQAGVLAPRGEKRGRYYVAAGAIAGIRQRINDSRDARDNTDPFADSD